MIKPKPWTYPEIERLRELGPTLTAPELAAAFGRTVASVLTKAYSEGINVKPKPTAS